MDLLETPNLEICLHLVLRRLVTLWEWSPDLHLEAGIMFNKRLASIDLIFLIVRLKITIFVSLDKD